MTTGRRDRADRPAVLVTGGTGFIGRVLVRRLLAEGFPVRVATRAPGDNSPAAAEQVVTGELSGSTDWSRALTGIDVVVHLAARVHVLHDRSPDRDSEYQRVNVEGTLQLARQSAAAGATRLIFLSSVKVHGEEGAFSEADPPRPADSYARTKLEAERGLARVSAETGLEVVIIRPPLVYGPGVRANFAALLRAVRRGVPLPLGALDNRRSLVAVDNLVDLIATCIDHPSAANETFLVTDGEALSTPELIRRLSRAMGRPPRLLRVPPAVMRACAAVAGRGEELRRLTGTLEVDGTRVRRVLGWTPVVTVEEALRRTVSETSAPETGG